VSRGSVVHEHVQQREKASVCLFPASGCAFLLLDANTISQRRGSREQKHKATHIRVFKEPTGKSSRTLSTMSQRNGHL
jgi:hypothetical protein